MLKGSYQVSGVRTQIGHMKAGTLKAVLSQLHCDLSGISGHGGPAEFYESF